MLSNRIARLALPPRRVPFPLVCSAMLGTAEGAGAFSLIVAILACWLIVAAFRPVDQLRLAFCVTTAPATVTEVTTTGGGGLGVKEYEYCFTFSAPDGRTITGRSYSTGQLWSVGDQVAAWYVPDEPAVARLDRTHISTIPPWLAAPTIALSIGLPVSFAIAVVHRLHQVMLLRYGKIANARKIWTKETSVSVPMVVNGKPKYDPERYTLQKYAVARYTYLFQASDGRIYRGTCKAPASEVVGDEAAEPILYLPSDPHVSTLVDALPLRCPLDVDDAGQWVSYESGKQVVWFVVVGLVIALAVGYGLSRLLGLL
jgi:hypothetical protein